MYCACEPASAYRCTDGLVPPRMRAGHFCYCFSRLRSQADVPYSLRVCTTIFPSRLALYYTTQPLSLTRVSLHPHTYSTLPWRSWLSVSPLFSFPVPVSWFWFYLSAFVAAYVIHQTFIHTHLSLSLIFSRTYLTRSADLTSFTLIAFVCFSPCIFSRSLYRLTNGHLARRPSPTAGFVSSSSASTSHSPELFAWTSVYHHHPALSYLCTCRTLSARLRATTAPASITLKSTQHRNTH